MSAFRLEPRGREVSHLKMTKNRLDVFSVLAGGYTNKHLGDNLSIATCENGKKTTKHHHKTCLMSSHPSCLCIPHIKDELELKCR